MDQIRYLWSKVFSPALLAQPPLPVSNTSLAIHRIGPFSRPLPFVHSFQDGPLVYSLRRHRGGKVKNKLRNLEKKKKREQFMTSTLDKLPRDAP